MLGVVKSVEVVTLDVTTGLTSLGTNYPKVRMSLIVCLF